MCRIRKMSNYKLILKENITIGTNKNVELKGFVELRDGQIRGLSLHMTLKLKVRGQRGGEGWG